MLSKFCASFFSKPYSSLRTVVKLFAAVPQIKETKIIVIEDSGHKCTCNNFTRESKNLNDLFCKSYILNLN